MIKKDEDGSFEAFEFADIDDGLLGGLRELERESRRSAQRGRRRRGRRGARTGQHRRPADLREPLGGTVRVGGAAGRRPARRQWPDPDPAVAGSARRRAGGGGRLSRSRRRVLPGETTSIQSRDVVFVRAGYARATMTTNVLPRIRSVAAARRRALVAVCAGNAMEWYDFALYAGSATVIAAVLTPGGWAGFTTVFAVFAMSCLFRPLGSLLIGARADRIGPSVHPGRDHPADGRSRPRRSGCCRLGGDRCCRAALPARVAGRAGVLGRRRDRRLRRLSDRIQPAGPAGVVHRLVPEHRRRRLCGRARRHRADGRAARPGRAAVLGLAGPVPARAAARRGRRSTCAAGSRSPRIRAPGRTTGCDRWRCSPSTGTTVRRCFVLAGAYSAAFNVWFLFLPSYVTATGASSLATVAVLCADRAAGHRGRGAAVRPAVRPHRPATGADRGASRRSPSAVVPLYLWMLGGSTAALLARQRRRWA